MPGFDVLSPNLDLFKGYFLEASAGTGKTFAIEHIVLRLLLEENGFTLDKILVVTFTKAATLELKRRIRNTLEKASQNPLSYPFLLGKSDSALFLIKKKLMRALALFDEAKIMTIHSFCQSCLISENMNIEVEEMDELGVKAMIKDYLRTECADLASFQMDKILRSYQLDLNTLIKDLTKIALRRVPIECDRCYEEQKRAFSSEMSALRKCYDSEKLYCDLCSHALGYKGMSQRNSILKEDVLQELHQFSCFNEDLSQYLRLSEMREENRLKRKVDCSFHYPGLLSYLQRNIFPIIEEANDEIRLFARLAEGVRKHIGQEKKALFHDDLLLQMVKRVENVNFSEKICQQFDAVLIDEFQDTDHMQWQIFSKLFVKAKKPLYLIGDPKQSIYRFRGADIYTYLNAKNAFEKKEHFTLNRNFRSTPELVSALNHLFLKRNPFLVLPKTNASLSYQAMESDPRNNAELKKDGKGSIHIWDGEKEEDFFPYILDEIRTLSKEWNIPLKEFAILVKDRHQADRFQKYSRSHGLHTIAKRSRPLTSGRAFQSFVELLEGLNHIKKKGALEKILGGAIFAYPKEKIELNKETSLIHLFSLKEKLETLGILPFFKMLMEGLYIEIISREEGVSFYSDLVQIVEILAENVIEKDEYLIYLHHLSTMSEDSEIIQAYAIGLEDGVPILTIHGSKGLEFEVVFALGVALTSKVKKELLFDSEKNILTLSEELFLQEQKENAAEKIRLFYVAATRAKKRLYLPYLENEKLSPISLFFENMGSIENNEISRSFCHDKEPLVQKSSHAIQNLIAPQPLTFNFSPCMVNSFSRMSHHFLEVPKKKCLGEPTLPIGKETGNLIHRILEQLPLKQAFALAKAEEFSPFVRGYLGDFIQYEKQICEMIYSAINCPLPNLVPLSTINPQKILRECEFLYPSSEGYLKGFIDLIFEHEKKLYIVDWKTNFLENYDEASLQQAMKDNAYDSQAAIYREAIMRFSKQFGILYGKTFFIFLRGLQEKRPAIVIS